MITLEKHLEINSKHFMVIINYLNSSGGSARLVGGVVRDSLLGIPCSDIDIATDLVPEKVTNILSKNGIKVIPTGIKFGTVTALFKNESFEITTLRKDIDCDGRHASVEYSNDFAQDAARRDFTINALSYCPVRAEIYDYFGGIKDLEAKKVVFIGDASKRVQEDYLRILRFFRFSARYAKEIDQPGLEVCTKLKGHLKNLSPERIKLEMDRLLLNSNAPDILEIMANNGILQEALPVENYGLELYKLALSMSEQFSTPPSLALMYAVLFQNSANVTRSALMNLKFPRNQASVILKMLDLSQFENESDLIFALKNIWLEEKEFVQYFIFASLLVKDNQSICNLYNETVSRDVPIFPVSGDEILKLGYSGKEVGRILDHLKKKWIDSEFAFEKVTLLDMVINNEK
jgi:poly(A) polymerase